MVEEKQEHRDFGQVDLKDHELEEAEKRYENELNIETEKL